MKWEITDKKNCYNGFLSIDEYLLKHELFRGGMTGTIKRQLLERGHAVAVILYDPALDNIVLIEQFRIGAMQDQQTPWLLELVAGMIDEDETEEAVALRETKEEAGIELIRCEKILHYYSSPGGCSEEISLFYGEVDSSKAEGIHGLDHEDEDIKVHVISYDAAIELLQTGRINSATPIIGLQWLQLNRSRLRDRC